MLQLLAFFGMGMGIAFMIPPLQRGLAFYTNQLLPNNILPENELVESLYRGNIDEEEYYEKMKKLGYDRDMADYLISNRRQLLSPEASIRALWREEWDWDTFSDNLKKQGWSDEDIKTLEKISRFYPSPSDFIRFSVREVFRPEVVEKYGYDKDFPEDIIPYVKKAGMDPEQLKWYWRAHWELPSPTAGYTMLHRLQPDVIQVIGDKYKKLGLNPDKIATDMDTLRELLLVSDYPEYWRDRLLAISYQPLTRVDLRRIYTLGLIDDEELKARLMELGYSPDDADLMVRFYKVYKNRSDRDLTRSQILDGFEEKLITRNEALELLQAIGYDPDEAEFIVTLEEAKIRDKEVKDQIAVLRDMYVNGAITKDKLKSELEKLDISLTKVERELIRAEQEKKRATQTPSKTDLVKWLKLDIIGVEEFIAKMRSIGFQDDDIKYYVKEAGKQWQT